MEVFEIHITGDEPILEKAAALGLKTISVELLRPDRSVIRTEHMTSDVRKFRNFECCKEYVGSVVGKLIMEGVKIERVKIESPHYEHYVPQSLYIESHFETDSNRYALSRNVKKTALLGTEREYDKRFYGVFRDYNKGREVEICLFDTNVAEDADWLDLYKTVSNAA